MTSSQESRVLDAGGGKAASPPVTRTYTGAALERRVAWGKDAGAKVAAAYKQLTEAK